MSDRDDLRDRLDELADELEEPEIIEEEIHWKIYELVSDEVSEDNQGELLEEWTQTFAYERSDG